MGRFGIVLLVIGGFLLFFGIQEWRVSSGASREPVKCHLADIEAERKAPDNHVEIGEHIALYCNIIYSFKTSKYGPREAKSDSRVDYAYYPIISDDHPFLRRLQQLHEKHGGEIPDKEVPAISDFTVLVKTHRFGRVQDLPKDVARAATVRGMMVSDITSLEGKAKEFIQEGFPGIDTSKILILEENRKPGSSNYILGMIGGGVALVCAAGMMFIVSLAKSRTPVTQGFPQPSANVNWPPQNKA